MEKSAPYLLRSENTLYLTFDDGMDPRYTTQLLDLLKQHGIHATFFILVSTAQQYPELFRRVKLDGHTVGLHSLDHKNQILQLPHSLCRGFRKCTDFFSTRDETPTCYRPPWGHVTPMGLWLYRRYDLKIVLWTVIIGKSHCAEPVSKIANEDP